VGLTRRSMLGAGLSVAAASLAGCAQRAADAAAGTAPAPSGAPTAAASPTAAAIRTPGFVTAKPGPPYRARLMSTLERYLRPTRENPAHPTYAGAVALVTVDGRTTAHVPVGYALRYGAGPVELPPSKRVRMRADSIFDLASITKVYTTILALQQVDRGRIDLDAPVREYLPEFTGTGKDAITVAMLMTHTSGLAVGPKVSGLPDAAARRSAVLATGLARGAVPGGAFRYSSTGLIVLGYLVEQVTGQTLDSALRHDLTGPLGLRDTGFKPLTWLGPADRAARLVATDARSSRGLLRGVVHDDVTNILGGVAGSAGIFATAADVAVIGQMLLDGGVYGGTRILAEATVRRMLTNANTGLPAIDAERPWRTSTHGLGVELNQPWFMGRLATAATCGHTGFTGTSLLVHPERRLVLVYLTNRAHPNWSWANPDPARAAVADVLADELR
jgi:CubicO group peptidase (beta-lactamase class C family)